jgi:hypothetical protein
MKKNIKKAWVEALRSGEYKQGRGRLCKTFNGEDLYCCLGVLANECADGYWVQSSDSVYDGYIEWGFTRSGYDGLPEQVIPISLEKKLGIDEKTMFRLANINDMGYTFQQIADWIEESL